MFKKFTTVSAHKFNNSNSIFLTFNLHMRSISCSLSFFNSSINSKRFVYHLQQQCNLHHFRGSIQFNSSTPIPKLQTFEKNVLSLENQTLLWSIKLQNEIQNSPQCHYQSSRGSQQLPLQDHISQLPRKNVTKTQIEEKKRHASVIHLHHTIMQADW